VANQFLNTNWISMNVLRLLVNSLTVAEYFNTSWDKDFKKEFAVGASVQVKFPQKFLIRDGLGYTPQPINRISTTVSLDQPFGIDFQWDDYEDAVKAERSKEEITEQYLQPAAAQLAQEIDSRAAQFAYQNSSNVIGILGTDPAAITTYYSVRRRMMEKAAPKGKRAMIISTSMMATLGGLVTSIFQPPDEVSKMFKDGALGRLAGFDWYESNSLWSHTAGTWAGAVTTTGANQSGTSLLITATAGDTFLKGDKFSIASVNAVNPMTRRIAGPAQAQQFTVTQDLTAAGGGADVLNFLPAIFGPGSQYQNVDALPGALAALTLWPGTAAPNGKIGTVGLALTPLAFAMVGAKLYSPKAVEVLSQKQDPKTGLAVRFVKAWDPIQSMQINRFDSLLGFGNLYQDNGAVAVVGA
jgi:hypothetical protein